MRPENERGSNPRSTNPMAPEGGVTTPVNLAEASQMIEQLQAALKAAQGMQGKPVLTQSLLDEIDAIGGDCHTLSVRLDHLRAALNKVIGATVKKPVFVYRYEDADGKEGFVLDDGPEAEGKARMLDADKKIEYGYAYQDEKDPNKFVGFHATATIDGTAPGRY